MGGSAAELILFPEARQKMLRHCLACLPEEACGMLGGAFSAGPGGPAVAQAVLPVTNALHSPVRFRMDPREQWKAFNCLDAQELDLVAIFHSHPTGPEHPSPTDLAEFAYPGVFSLILSPCPGDPSLVLSAAWQVLAFEISGEPPAWKGIPVRIAGLSQPGQA